MDADLSGTREQNRDLGGVRVRWRYTLVCMLKRSPSHILHNFSSGE